MLSRKGGAGKPGLLGADTNPLQIKHPTLSCLNSFFCVSVKLGPSDTKHPAKLSQDRTACKLTVSLTAKLAAEAKQGWVHGRVLGLTVGFGEDLREDSLTKSWDHLATLCLQSSLCLGWDICDCL